MPVQLPGWNEAETIVLISAELGAKFAQYLVHCRPGANLQPLREQDELFVLVMAGEVNISCGETRWHLQADAFCYLPAAQAWRIESAATAELLIFSKPYIALAEVTPPQAFKGALAEVPAEPFLGDKGALLQVLLPDDLAFDWGINLFEFAPGGTLPQVESHFMEHGLYLLAGQGVYRLGESWYPVQAGDCIWMGPYLPQWYAATGKANSRYIYYKEMQRAPVG